MKEKRSQNRYLCADLVRIDWILNEDEFRTAEAVLEDISAAGACVQLEEAVPLGATLLLTLADEHFSGHVCYCLHQEFGYFVGVRFADEDTWSSERILPRHLTNLADLVAHEHPGVGALSMNEK